MSTKSFGRYPNDTVVSSFSMHTHHGKRQREREEACNTLTTTTGPTSATRVNVVITTGAQWWQKGQNDATHSPLPSKTKPSVCPPTHFFVFISSFSANRRVGVFLFIFLETSFTDSLLASFLSSAGWLWEACKKIGGRGKQRNGEKQKFPNRWLLQESPDPHACPGHPVWVFPGITTKTSHNQYRTGAD